MVLAYRNSWFELKETSHTVVLYEHYCGGEVEYGTVLGRLLGWRKQALLELAAQMGMNGRTDDLVDAMRLYVAIKLLSGLKRPELKDRLLRVVGELPIEEVMFWAWKVSSNGKGTHAFKVLYGVA